MTPGRYRTNRRCPAVSASGGLLPTRLYAQRPHHRLPRAGRDALVAQARAQDAARPDLGARRRSHIAHGERGLWQSRYWEHHIRDQADFAAHLRYGWINPVKYGLVMRPEDWLCSCVHREIGGRGGGGRVRASTHLCGGRGIGACEHAP